LTNRQLTHDEIPSTADQKQALQMYMKALKDAGFSSVTVASPTGEVVASTDPGLLQKKIRIPKRRAAAAKQPPISLSAEFKDVDIDPGVEQRTYSVQFPIVRGDKVIGYLQARGLGEEVQQLLHRAYVVRLFCIIATLLVGRFAL